MATGASSLVAAGCSEGHRLNSGLCFRFGFFRRTGHILRYSAGHGYRAEGKRGLGQGVDS